jgi:hypothetical protein
MSQVEKPNTHTDMTTLKLTKKWRGYYELTAHGITVSVTDTSVVVGGRAQKAKTHSLWQLMIETEDRSTELLNVFCATKRECYAVGVEYFRKTPL